MLRIVRTKTLAALHTDLQTARTEAAHAADAAEQANDSAIRAETAFEEQQTDLASGAAMRFLTQGGAQVHITHTGTFTRTNFSGATWGEKDHRWTCLGCDEGSGRHDHYSLSEIRDAANAHATECRSMPKPASA